MVEKEKVIALAQPESNKALIAEIENLLAQAKDGEFQGAVVVKLRTNRRFYIWTLGTFSHLQTAGALSFALHDLISGNPGEKESDV
jgi:hypothetical protein